MAHIYLALVDTPGLFACMIRRFIRQRYIHVVIAADAGLEEAYSVGRRNSAVPLLAGFEREEKEKILRVFPSAQYRICELECTAQQKQEIMKQLREDYGRRSQIHYAVAGLPFIVAGRPFYIRDRYTCSSYIARLLEEYGIFISEKHFSLVTPKDFYECADMRVVFEGKLMELEHGRTAEYGGVGWEEPERRWRLPAPAFHAGNS